MQFFFLVFLSFWTVCAYTKLKQQQKIRFREKTGSVRATKLAPALGKSATDFGKFSHRSWGNPSPILWKSVTDFVEIRHQF